MELLEYLTNRKEELKGQIDDIISELVSEFEESERMDNVRDAINEKFSIQEGK